MQTSKQGDYYFEWVCHYSDWLLDRIHDMTACRQTSIHEISLLLQTLAARMRQLASFYKTSVSLLWKGVSEDGELISMPTVTTAAIMCIQSDGWPAVCLLVPSGKERWWGRWRRSGSPGLTWRIIQHHNNQLEASRSINLHTNYRLTTATVPNVHCCCCFHYCYQKCVQDI